MLLLKLFLANLKMITRNRQALFWSFMFPLLFTFIFGFFFGKSNRAGTVAIIDQANNKMSQTLVTTLDKAELFKIKTETDIEKAKSDIKKSTISSVIIIPEGFGNPADPSKDIVKIIYDPGNAQGNQVLLGFFDRYFTTLNYQIQNAKPIFGVEQDAITSHNLTYFDFVLAGILGLALMNSSVIGVGVGITRYREDKILKRIVTTPLPSWIFIVAEVLSRLVLNFFQVSVILLIGKYFFDAHIYGSLFIIFALALLGAILFQLLGFVIASVSKTTDAAQGMATAITIPMMFLAGVFFPTDSLPTWLYSIVQYLPLAPLLRMLRTVTLEGGSAFANPINMIIVASWIIACLLFSIFRFRLSEE